MSEFRIDKITNRTGDTGPQICGVSTFSGTSGMAMPSGPTEYRGGRGRAVIGGGNTPSDVNTLDRIEISTTGDATDFGDLSQLREQPQAASSSTRGVWTGGKTSTSTMDYVVISSEGGASTFGDLIQGVHSGKGVSDGTTALWMGGKWSGGYSGPSPIQFTIIASTGGASDFGDIAGSRVYSQTGAFASPTRGLIGGGATPRLSPSYQNTIDYITIATKGDTKDFGDISALRSATGGCASPTRGLFMGGQVPGSQSDVIDYVTIATIGNATDFGNLTTARSQTDGGSSHTRGFCPGGDTGSVINTIDYVTISSTGNAADFGDLSTVRRFTGTCSDSHGGLG